MTKVMTIPQIFCIVVDVGQLIPAVIRILLSIISIVQPRLRNYEWKSIVLLRVLIITFTFKDSMLSGDHVKQAAIRVPLRISTSH